MACAFSAGEYKSELAIKWLSYCKDAIPIGKGRIGHDEYLHYYFAQAMYEPMQVPGGWAGLLCDPQGVVFGLFSME